MDAGEILDIAQQAIWISLLISAPVLLTGMLIGLVVGLLQAVTQVQEQTVAFVPKMLAMVLVFSLALPWLISQMVQYTADLFGGIAGRL